MYEIACFYVPNLTPFALPGGWEPYHAAFAEGGYFVWCRRIDVTASFEAMLSASEVGDRR